MSDKSEKEMYEKNKRAHFAICVLNGFLANPTDNSTNRELIEQAVMFADLLLAELEK